MTSEEVLFEDVENEVLLNLVASRVDAVAQFIRWASACLELERPLRLQDRKDLAEARSVAAEFAEPWWGVIVYTCFGTIQGADRARKVFGNTPPQGEIQRLASLLKEEMEPGDIGGHRIQPGHKGAVIALTGASEHAEAFHLILTRKEGGFDRRYKDLLDLDVSQWKRTTSFDLMLRAGWLGVAGRTFAPEIAYLRGSQGPRAGLMQVLDIGVSSNNAAYCEGLLRAWTRNWAQVCNLAKVGWNGDPFGPGDFENALCIYQEPVRAGWPEPAAFSQPS